MKYISSLLTGSPLPTKEFPKRKVNFDSELSKVLQPCDIILYRSLHNDFPSNVIKHYTSSPYPHVELHLRDGYDISATSTGLSYVDIIKTEAVDVLRLRRKKPITREERLIMFAKAAQSVLLPYNYGMLFFFPWINKKNSIKLASQKAYICSELTDWIYNEAGIKLFGDTPTPMISPADFGLNTDKLEYLGTFLDGKRIEGNYRNEIFDDKEKGHLGEKFAEMLESLSTRDEFYKERHRLFEGK